ncbi:MAG: hypothetical protein A3A33_05135 [Candidatus Yanofskybacteria bacterium RIFCSPLOWO2_01_FULL_49_25]|uniref:Uncharacterized protein n=1 Tax=Candidatus Yanofskybacteria bacterium RIFCSPLOWO2_01_FULL_49_25 TaxID=1802701 RepID=A0A1F8GSL6_9BACT|nr:MAG: hypothetical protein A3A33_05135 [Candidatus Yanofskybacteria bacterium RIFCSPLOWO2_01_FULL_49_25]
MKSFIIIIILCSFVGIASFGLLAMHYGTDQGGNSSCIGAIAQGSDCPSTDIFSSVIFHFNSSRIFSTAVFGQSILLLLIAIVMLSCTDIAIIDTSNPRKNSFVIRVPFLSPHIIHWLALHENSPAFIEGY